MQLSSGTLLERGKYRIIETLGRGGFGITYLAEHVMAKRKVCIKEFFPKDYYIREDGSSTMSLVSATFAESMGRFKQKFIKEAQTIATLDHNNIIHIHDVFEDNNTAYYVMEYIEGESLSSLVKRQGALDETTAVDYIRQVACALDYIHKQRIMHLDIKPGNIMLRQMDNRVILIDFGLSKHYDAQSGEATSTTPVGVSHGFAPLEQYRQGGVSLFSPETDIYSLGATLYYLVTGTVPPEAADVADGGLPALPAHLSNGVRKAIERSMADKRKQRPQNIGEFLALLEDESTIVAATPIPEPVSKAPVADKNTSSGNEKRRKSRWLVFLLLVMVVAFVDVFIFDDEDAVPIPTSEEVSYYKGGTDISIPEKGEPDKNSDDTGNVTQLEEPTNPGASTDISSDEYYGHEYVDLGLSVMWATCNIGAKYSHQPGGYYDPSDIEEFKKVKWDGDWRLPTKEECQELIDSCEWIWKKSDWAGSGYKIKGPSGQEIFLPAAGWMEDGDTFNVGTHGYYRCNINKYGFGFNNNNEYEVYPYGKSDRHSVRLVLDRSVLN